MDAMRYRMEHEGDLTFSRSGKSYLQVQRLGRLWKSGLSTMMISGEYEKVPREKITTIFDNFIF